MEYFISTSGNDSNPGTFSQPWRNLEKLRTLAPSFLNPGDIVSIRAGTYLSTVANNVSACVLIQNWVGTALNQILVRAYPPDFPSGGRVTYDCTNVDHIASVFGIRLNLCSFVKFYGIYVKGPGQTVGNGIACGSWWHTECNNCTVENCEGSHTMSPLRHDICNNQLYLNCDAHHANDPYTGPPTGAYNNSDGFGRYGVGSSSPGTVYRGCRAWFCSDDGWDCFGTNGSITYDHCWSIMNGYSSEGVLYPDGDGNGFKMGPSTDTGLTRILNNCIAFGNKTHGFDQNTGNFKAQFYNNSSINNGVNDWKFGYNQPIAHIFRNNLSYGNGIIDGSTSDADNWSPNDFNTWNGGVTVDGSDFINLTASEFLGPRQANGNLPIISAAHLAPGSDLIDAGVNVGLVFTGTAPDIGAFETGGVTPPVTPAYYVATTGSDTNPGTDVSPFLTLAKAEAVAVAGTQVYIYDGTYAGITTTKNGALSQPIVFSAINPGGVELTTTLTILNNNFRVFYGFVFNDVSDKAIRITGANNTILNTTITGSYSTGYGIFVGQDANTGGEAADNNIIDRLTLVFTSPPGQMIHGVLFGGGGTGNILRNSYLEGSYYGVVDKAEQSSLIYNNVFKDLVYTAIYNKGTANGKYYNNILYQPSGGYGYLQAASDGGSPLPVGASVIGNLFVKGSSVDPAIYNATDTPFNALDYNLFSYSASPLVYSGIGPTGYTDLTAWQVTGNDIHSIEDTPIFTNGSGLLNTFLDFTPDTGSPVIDAGITYNGRTTDGVGNLINAVADIGAFEFEGIEPPVEDPSDPIASLTINFVPCDPIPEGGYQILYRAIGDVTYIDAGFFLVSPAIIAVAYPAGTQFEGVIRSGCGDVPWSTT